MTPELRLISRWQLGVCYRHEVKPEYIDLVFGSLPLFPVEDIRKCLEALIRNYACNDSEYGECQHCGMESGKHKPDCPVTIAQSLIATLDRGKQ